MDSVPLSYLLAHPTSLGLAAEKPLFLLLLAAAALFFLVPIDAAGRRVAALRAAAVACIVASLAGLSLTTSLPSKELSIVAAVDVSSSISDAGIEWSRRFLHSLRSSLAPGDRLSVLTFADSPAIQSIAAEEHDIESIERSGEAAGTNIAAAIDQAMGLFPAASQKSLLLLSDGNETTGDSKRRIETLRALAVRIDAVSPAQPVEAAVRIARLTAPAIAAPERPVPLRVVIRNGRGAHPAVLNLYLDNRITDSVAVELAAGLNTFDFLLSIPAPGGHVIRAEVVLDGDGDATVALRSRERSLTVRADTHVLLATNRRYSALAEALEARGVLLQRIRPSQLPVAPSGYSHVHLVVLEDPRAADVSSRAASALEQFLRIHGGGLLFVGGRASFGDRAFHGTEIEKVLPISLEPHRPRPGKRDPLALFLVIDRSNSMGFNSRIGTLRDGEKLRYAIKAGVAVVQQLRDHDRVGVIAFDARPHEIAPLRPLKANRQRLLDALPRIVESGGTDFFDAMVSAGDQLAKSRVARKHIVLLTDGDTNRADRGEYRKLTAKLARDGISVTTIRIGDNTVNLKLLQDISQSTGGTFHHVENVQMLPDLMLRDTSRALQPLSPSTDQYFPAIGVQHQLLVGTDEGEIPPLRDYAFSKPRPSSETLLHVTRAERRDPILSVWRYGLGRVGAFTASPGEDAEGWPSWTGFSRFWSQLAFWAARRESDDDLVVEAVRHRHATVLSARSFRHIAPSGNVSAVLDAAGTRIDVDFNPIGPTDFEARTIPLSPGRYPLRLRMRADGSPREIDTVVAVPAQFDEERKEFDHGGDNTTLLRQLATRTGGKLNPTVRDVLDRPVGGRTASYPLAGWLIPMAMAAFFTDIALRRLNSQGAQSRRTSILHRDSETQ